LVLGVLVLVLVAKQSSEKEETQKLSVPNMRAFQEERRNCKAAHSLLTHHARFADQKFASLKAERIHTIGQPHNTAYANVVCDNKAYANVVCDCYCVNGNGNHTGIQRWGDLNRLLGMLK
jgi:hypothetical protein